jgi:SAM-dependent methyltransferase
VTHRDIPPPQGRGADRSGAWGRVWDAAFESVRGPAREACIQWWRGRFAEREGVEAVLELGAGAAALASRMAAAAFPGARIVASDFRGGLSFEPPIEFVADARIEALGFPDASFDLIASQFAFEYAPRELALSEAARVLRPSGQVLLIMHAEDSHYAGYLGERIAVLTAGEKIADAIPRGRALHDLHRISLKRAVAGAAQLRERYVGKPGWENVLQDIDSLRAIGERVLTTRSPALSEEEAFLLQNCRDALILARDQQAASLSEQGLAAFAAQGRAAGFLTVAHERILSADRRVVGWGLRLSR